MAAGKAPVAAAAVRSLIIALGECADGEIRVADGDAWKAEVPSVLLRCDASEVAETGCAANGALSTMMGSSGVADAVILERYP